MRSALSFLLLLPLAACHADRTVPALSARPAEALDPRLPVGSTTPPPGELTVGEAIAALAARLSEGRDAFAAQWPSAEAAASAAGARGSESWVRAQEEMGLLVRSREGVARVLADAAELATGQIARDGWASPRDRAALEALLADASDLDRAQAAALARLEARIAR
ncbi:hypothetical protein [Sphingomicrobium astaxanthinifaciens]|uniref:hypothetical protein n=1 Tax=Sphingomicrobium astaxanthinifaciens TaxID=1227949 RepID=UPI001FCB682C|nr:hypothetical protein [Sphingomicrobium astaxanthinifaciens]MCJ7420655.1 hypothetical protein [Sphingomicrobium astaxanthinifaciens]